MSRMHLFRTLAFLTVCLVFMTKNARGAPRELREIITTTACRNIRRAEDYPARMDMIYVYFVDFVGDYDSLDLTGIERAIATSVASTFNSCDAEQQPVNAVELSEVSEHKLIATRKSQRRFD